MINIIKQNKILFIVLTVVIVLFIGYGVSDRNPSTGLIQKQSASGSSAVEQEILQLLMDVQSITLDSAIFQDPAFVTLRDFGRKIIQEPSGRENPFIPPNKEFATTTTNQI